MKKTLLAAAIAVGFAGAAHAQTNVTLYGVVDGGLGYTRYKDDRAVAPTGNKASRVGLHDGVQQGNRWGLRGTEDLGGGLRAVFQLESGWSLATGNSAQNNRLFGREASLALASDSWGTVKFGRHTNFAARYAGGVLAPQGDAFSEGHIGATFTSTATVRADNLITYETPVFSGFQFGIGYSFNVNNGQPWDRDRNLDRDVSMLTLGMRYINGPLAVAAAYDQLNAPDGVANPNTPPVPPVIANTARDVKSWLIGASYDFDVVKLHLGFGQDRNGTFGGRTNHLGTTAIPTLPRGLRGLGNPGGLIQQGAFGFVSNSYKTNNYSVGLGVPLSTGEFSVSWHSARLGSGSYKNNAEEDSQSIYSAKYTYPFSKRTNLYAVGTYGNGYAFNDVTVTQLVVGLRHRF